MNRVDYYLWENKLNQRGQGRTFPASIMLVVPFWSKIGCHRIMHVPLVKVTGVLY